MSYFIQNMKVFYCFICFIKSWVVFLCTELEFNIRFHLCNRYTRREWLDTSSVHDNHLVIWVQYSCVQFVYFEHEVILRFMQYSLSFHCFLASYFCQKLPITSKTCIPFFKVQNTWIPTVCFFCFHFKYTINVILQLKQTPWVQETLLT